MKKKIKDLTVQECKSICAKTKDCDKCPLNVCHVGVITCPDYIEKEVEIYESNNDKH